MLHFPFFTYTCGCWESGSWLTSRRFVVEDEKYNYISARYPGDMVAMAERLVKLAKQLKTA